MIKLIITLVRTTDPDVDMPTAINVLGYSDVLRNSSAGDSGILKDDDGLLAVWEWVEE